MNNRVLITKEIKDLFFSKTALLVSLLVSFILGYSFYLAVTLYSNASISALNNPLYARGFEPVPGVFVPTYGGLFIIFTLFLPFLFIPIIGLEKRYNTIMILVQLSFNLGRILTSKIFAAIFFLLLILILSIPSIIIWNLWGGHVPYGELSLLALGYLMYALLVLSISMFSSSLLDNTASASILAVVLLISSWLIDFGKEMNLSPILLSMSEWTFTRNLKYFEEGIFSLRALLYFIFLASGLLVATYLLLRFDLKKRWRWLIILLGIIVFALFLSSKIYTNRDSTESFRNSFAPNVVKALKNLPNLEIDAYLERTDSRFKDYEKSFLQKLYLIRGDIKIKMMKGDALKNNYGLFVYMVSGKSGKTFSNSEEEIFSILFPLAGIKLDRSENAKEYPGYPLVTTGKQQSVVLYIYFLLIPLGLVALFVSKNVKTKRRYSL